MDKIVKTGRVSSELSGMSMTKVVSAIEDYAFQLKSVVFLRESGEVEAADKLEEKIIWDLGKNIADIVDEGYVRKSRRRKKDQFSSELED